MSDTVQRHRGPKPRTILVLGPRGCGKSSFINAAVGKSVGGVSTGPDLCTRQFWTGLNQGVICDHEFKFIDSPGFDNAEFSDWDILAMLVEYFSPPKPRDTHSQPMPQKLEGIIYIHPEDDHQCGRTSPETIRMLGKLLGESYLERVTVLIRSQNKMQEGSKITDFTTNSESPLHPLYCGKSKPTTMTYTLDRQSIEKVLSRYTALRPGWFTAQYKFVDHSWKTENIRSHLQEFFSQAGYTGRPAIIGQAKDEELKKLQKLVGEKDEELEKFRKSTQEKDKKLAELHELMREKHGELEKFRNSILEKDDELGKPQKSKQERDRELEQPNKLALEKDGELEKLRKLTQEKEAELEKYHKLTREKDEELEKHHKLARERDEELDQLRSLTRQKDEEIERLKSNKELKQPESTDRDLRSLNLKLQRTANEYASFRSQVQIQDNVEQVQITGALKDINRLIEELGQAISSHLVDNYPQPTASLQAAFESQELLNILGCAESKALLARVSRKGPLEPEDIFYYIVRATLCHQLYRQLFEPFHPSIAHNKQQNEFIVEMYRRMVYRESQLVAGRWRRDSFNSISVSGDQPPANTICQTITNVLRTLLGSYFESSVDVTLTKEHETMLSKLIDKAERWNQLLKGSVVLLGEFQPKVYCYGNEFRSDYMSEIGATSNGTDHDHPRTILATIELGLIKYYALGGNRDPEETVIHKAEIVSEKWFG